MGLGLIALVSLAYLWHRAPFWYAVTLAIAFSADSLDGAVARLRHESSAFGGYLDAVVDRYQEMIALAALAYAGVLVALGGCSGLVGSATFGWVRIST